MARLSTSEKNAVRAAIKHILQKPEERAFFSDKQLTNMEAASYKYNMPKVEQQRKGDPLLYEVIGDKLGLPDALRQELKEVLSLSGVR